MGTATVAYGCLTGAWAVFLWGQIFAVASTSSLILSYHYSGWTEITPVAALGASTYLLARPASSRWPSDLRALAPHLALIYWAGTCLLLVVWIFAHLQAEWRVLAIAGLGCSSTREIWNERWVA